MARVFAIAALVVGGIIVADIWRNPGGTQAAASGLSTIERPAFNALLGQTS